MPSTYPLADPLPYHLLCPPDPLADFNAIKPTNLLNTSVAQYRSRIGGTTKRKQPSQAHLRKMRSSGDVLENLPKGALCDLDKPLEDGSLTPQPLDASPRATSADSKEAPSPAPQPKPRPRAAPRKKPQPSPSMPDEAKESKKTPQAVPRVRAQSADNLDATRPSPKDRVSSEKSSGDEKSDESPKHPVVNGVEKPSPVKVPKPSPSARQPHIGPKPSPKAAGKPPAKDPVDSPVSDATGDQVSPSRSRNGSMEKEATVSSSSDVDPSKLSVKEKALLAQKALMSTPEKPKPGPPRVARKPKPTPGTPVLSPETPEEGMSMESRIRRAQSVDDGTGGSPQQKRKLPPGAINMLRMGAIPMFGPSADRGRSVIVATSDSRNSLEGGMSSALRNSDIPGEGGEEGTDAPSEVASNERSPFHAVSVLPVQKPSPNDSGAELDDSTSPQAPPKFEHKDSDATTPASPMAKEVGGAGAEFTAADYDFVLMWTPDVTASWLGHVGLGSHGQAFAEKGIQGYMLFDIDGSKLKVWIIHTKLGWPGIATTQRGGLIGCTYSNQFDIQ